MFFSKQNPSIVGNDMFRYGIKYKRKVYNLSTVK
jgi:hypothetical protein